VTALAPARPLSRIAGLAASVSSDAAGVTALDLPLGRALFDPRNARLKLYGVGAPDLMKLAQGAADGAQDDRVTKIIVYATSGDDEEWKTLGLRREAVIRGFHADSSDAVLWSGFVSAARGVDQLHVEHERIVHAAKAKGRRAPRSPQGYRLGCAAERDAGDLAALLQTVFSDYPSSLEEGHLCSLVRSGASFFVTARDEAGSLVATMSAEIDMGHRSAEMTDCATRPDHRGRGLMPCLLAALEREVPLRFGISDFYTIARADAAAVNVVFARQGYEFTGRLVNNCRMPNGWESMNVWCKRAGGDGASEAGRGPSAVFPTVTELRKHDTREEV
jgi:putative beta-lysine N-acetyltransferase